MAEKISLPEKTLNPQYKSCKGNLRIEAGMVRVMLTDALADMLDEIPDNVIINCELDVRITKRKG